MADKQPLKATFFAFRKREKGGVLFGATLAYFGLALVMLIAFVVLNLGALGGFFTWYGNMISASINNPGAPPDMSVMPANLGGFFISYLLVIFVSFILLASWEATCLRWMVRGERGGFLGLTFGADMWRVYAGYWLWAVMIIVVVLVLSLVGGLIVGVLSSTMRDSNPGVAMAATAFLPLLVYGGLGIFSVRFAPAAATSIGLRKFAFFQAWTVTRGRFWALFGSFFLLWLLYFIGIIIFYAVVIVAALSLSGASMGHLGSDPTAFTQAFASAFAAPTFLISLAVVYVLYLIYVLTFVVLMFGVNARAVNAAGEEGKVAGLTGPAADAFT